MMVWNSALHNGGGWINRLNQSLSIAGFHLHVAFCALYYEQASNQELLVFGLRSSQSRDFWPMNCSKYYRMAQFIYMVHQSGHAFCNCNVYKERCCKHDYNHACEHSCVGISWSWANVQMISCICVVLAYHPKTKMHGSMLCSLYST